MGIDAFRVDDPGDVGRVPHSPESSRDHVRVYPDDLELKYECDVAIHDMDRIDFRRDRDYGLYVAAELKGPLSQIDEDLEPDRRWPDSFKNGLDESSEQ